MISVFLAWVLCSVSFIGGFILCSLIKVGQKADDITLVSIHDDYIDWSKVPEEYDWGALDSGDDCGINYTGSNCLLGLYKKEPTIQIWGGWRGDGISDSWANVLKCESAIIGPLPPWKESLRKRPEVKS